MPLEVKDRHKSGSWSFLSGPIKGRTVKASITLDFYDGSQSKSKEVFLEEVSMHDLIFMMMKAGVAGITITKIERLDKMLSHMKEAGETHEGG